MRKMILFPVKIALIPVALVCTLGIWIGGFFEFVSAWIFYLLALIVFLTAIGSWGFELEPMSEVIRMLLISFGLYLIPHVAGSLIEILGMIKELVLNVIFE